MSSAIQLDLSRQKLYISPEDPLLPEFYPPPRAILVTPIYDNTQNDPPLPDSNQHSPPHSPWIVNRTSEHRYAYQTSPSNRRYDDRHSPYSRDRRHPRDSSRLRRSSDSSDNGHYQHPDYYYDRSDREYSSEANRSSDRDRPPLNYDRPPSNYDHPPTNYDRPPTNYDRPPTNYDRPPISQSHQDSHPPHPPPSNYDRPLISQSHQDSHPPHPPPTNHDRPPITQSHDDDSPPHQTSSQPNLPPTNDHATRALSMLQTYLERNRQAACRDPFQHLKMFPAEIQKVLKALPPSPHFCWSECTGRRKAVCIGVNYVGQKDALKGCGNDARRLMSFLVNYYGFNSQDIFLLTDDGQKASMTPTRENMLYAMNWLVKDAKMHDSLVFHYSGHGGQVKDETGTEADGMDEVIFPVDFKSTSHIVDNELFNVLVKPLPTGCRLTAIFDSCHSGTVLDLPYLHSAHGRLRSLGHISRRAKERGVAPNPDVICLAACKDDETSADSFQGGIYVGAMSYALFKILKANAKEDTHLTYGQILQQLRKTLIPKFNQKAQISGTHPVDLEREFTL